MTTAKLSNFRAIKKLVVIRENVLRAMIEADAFHASVAACADAGAVPGFETGYACHIHGQSDGSGASVNLAGCYVRAEVAMAVSDCLAQQLARVNSALQEYGIDTTA